MEMHLVKNDGKVLNYAYMSNVFWLDDLDFFIKSEYRFEVSKGSSVDLLDKVCAHLTYWNTDNREAENISEKVVQKISEHSKLDRILGLNGDIVNPELVIYDFNGTSIYDQISDNKITYIPENESLIIEISEKDCKFILSREDFENYFNGEIMMPEEDDDEIFFGHSTGNVVFFMTPHDEEDMIIYLTSCIKALNEIYESLGMQVIKIK